MGVLRIFPAKLGAKVKILIPPEAIDNELIRPDYLVTANCLVYKDAFNYIGGFDENFQQAGGEDIDLGFRLLSIGSIAYQWNSIVLHNFDDGIKGFIKRFNRYGKGNKQLAHKHMLNLTPKPFLPIIKTPYNIILAVIQFLFMSTGYHLNYITNPWKKNKATLRFFKLFSFDLIQSKR